MEVIGNEKRASRGAAGAKPERDVVIFSQRERINFIWHASWYEFEDVVADVEGAQIISTRSDNPYGLRYRARRRVARNSGLYRQIPSGHEKRPIGRDIDLFACFVQHPDELTVLDAVPDWRERSKLAVCLLEEVWLSSLADLGRLYDELSAFDVVVVTFRNTAGPLSERIGRPVLHMPCAVDMGHFASTRPAAERPIDLYYMGRRRPGLHERLLDRMADQDRFYMYTTFAMPVRVRDHREHREQFVSMVNRTRLFFVDYAKFDKASETVGQVVWGPRYFEGMCGGAVSVGMRPDAPDFDEYLGWPDAVVQLDERPDPAVDQIMALVDQTDELDRISRVNLAESLLRHDWAHRWAQVLDALGLEPTARMRQRLTGFQTRSEAISAGS